MNTPGTRLAFARHRRRVPEFDAENANARRKAVYGLGGVAALTIVLVALLDIVVSLLAGERDVEPGKLGATEWFARFEDSRFLALRDLGLLNVANTTLAIPPYLALYWAHRRKDRPLAALAATLAFMGASVYAANNKALPMLALSKRYAAAGTDAERARLATAGEAMLAQGEDFTPGSFPGFLLTEVAGVVLGITMLRGGIFGRANAWAGIAGSSLLLVFTAWVTFAPAAFRRAMVLATGGGLLSMASNVLTARRLFRLGKEVSAISCDQKGKPA